MRSPRQSAKPLAGNETFVRLIRIAEEDASVRSRILDILRLDPLSRKDTVRGLVQQMLRQGAPADFAESIACLADDEVAAKVQEILGGGGA